MSKIIDFAQNVLGVRLFEGQAGVLADYYASRRPNWLLLAGRRSGKSLISDIIACYESVVPDFGDIVRPGEDRYVIVVSTRADNAALHIRNISSLLKHDRNVGKLITAVQSDRILLSNGVTILSLPASARAGRGYTASCVVLDELAHFVDSSGNASADQVFDAFSPTVATFGDLGRIVITTTPMSRTGIVFDLYDRSEKGELDDFFVTRRATRELNPKVSERTIARAMKRDELSAMVEYFAEFSDPVASYLDSEAVERAVDRSRREQAKGEPGKSYIMAIDPATMGDRYAYAIMHSEEGRKYLDYAHILKPPVNPNTAEELLESLVERFRPLKIRCDTAATVERLKYSIPAMEYTPFSRPMKLRIYGSLKEALNLDQLILYHHEDLLDELKSLQIRNGVDIAAPRSGRITHDDLADVLALCVDALVNEPGGMSWVKDPFAGEWPPPEDKVWSWERGWISPNKYHKHSAGAESWETCSHRAQGCDECERELEASGYFQRQEEAARELGQTLTEEQYLAWRQEIRRPWQPPISEEEQAANYVTHLIVQKIKKESRDV